MLDKKNKIHKQNLIKEFKKYPEYAVPNNKYLKTLTVKQLKKELIRLMIIFKDN